MTDDIDRHIDALLKDGLLRRQGQDYVATAKFNTLAAHAIRELTARGFLHTSDSPEDVFISATVFMLVDLHSKTGGMTRDDAAAQASIMYTFIEPAINDVFRKANR